MKTKPLNVATTISVSLLGVTSFWVSSHTLSWLPKDVIATFAEAMIALSPANKILVVTLFFYAAAFVSSVLVTSIDYLMVLRLFRTSVLAASVTYFSGYIAGCLILYCVGLLYLPHDTTGIIEFSSHTLSFISGASVVWAGIHYAQR